MEQAGPALALVLTLVPALVPGFTHAPQAWDQLDFCRGKVCPRFSRTATRQNYEERLYEKSVWMCTEVSGTSISDAISASDRLKFFIQQKKQELGEDISENTAPGLVVQKQAESGPKYEMCWLVRPEVALSDSDEGPVKVKTFPQTSFFVRSFGGTPSLEGGRENAKKLKEDLQKNGESFDPSEFFGAGYESYFSLFHHNEIWIRKV